MRYTTLIDISEDAEIYANHNARLIYLHMALRAGYHDDDRDELAISERQLAWETGVTYSAARNALTVLKRKQLVTRDGHKWKVKKWLEPEAPPTRRSATAEATTTTARRDEKLRRAMDAEEREATAYQESVARAIRSCTAEQLRQWYDELREGKSHKHRNVVIKATIANVEWFKREVIDKLK